MPQNHTKENFTIINFSLMLLSEFGVLVLKYIEFKVFCFGGE